MLEVRKATYEDTDSVLDFYHAMIDEMRGTDFDIFWKRDVHPSDKFLRDSIAEGFQIIGIAEDGNIACALVMNRTSASGYEQAPWKISGSEDEIGIVHLVATRPDYHGRGFAKQLMNDSIAIAREEGLLALRLDTFVDNVRSHGLYDKLGFINHGAWPIHYSDLGVMELDLFEYVL